MNNDLYRSFFKRLFWVCVNYLVFMAELGYLRGLGVI
jgi:hypothetical protein